MKHCRSSRPLVIRVCVGGIWLLAGILSASAVAQLATIEHLAKPGFWPTKISSASEDFVGAAACAKCHPTIAAKQGKVPMARTLAHVDETEVLRSHPRLTFQQGPYRYALVTSAVGSTYTVSDDTRSLSASLLWAFGAGTVGQSYLYQHEGQWYEARASFFGTLGNLNFTPGRALASPHGLEEAMSRTVSNTEVMGCFRCHAVGVTSESSVDTAHLFLGVSCEACHGAGGKHVSAMQAESLVDGGPSGEVDRELIFDPGQLSATDSVDFCGACHSTWWDVRLSGKTGTSTVISPGYRLENSKCWGKGDARLACTTCHDPHGPLEHRADVYDSKCLGCHVSVAGAAASPDHPGVACPISKTGCTSCHMPKVDIPELHRPVTDHDIRVVRPGAPLPG
jgi:Cytochrome c554 and c-prime